MLRKQKFGVEVEMTGITRETAAKVVGELLGNTPSRPSGCYHTRTILDSVGRNWKVMYDSSIKPTRNDNSHSCIDEYKVELVTPPLNYEDIELLQHIIRKLRGSGAKVNNHSPASLKRLVNFMIERQDLLYEALETGQRERRWCRKLNADILKEMKGHKELTKADTERIWYSAANDQYTAGIDHSHYNVTRYHGVNLHSFFTKGTIEFRLFNSTLHAGKIKAYIQFCLAVSAWAITSKERVVFRSMSGYTPEQKVTIMRNILTQRLGLRGDEFKTCRLWLMTPLKKSAGMNCRVA